MLMQAGRHELQPGEGSLGEQERAGGGSGGESSAWRGALICPTDYLTLAFRRPNNSSLCWSGSLTEWKLNWGQKMPSFQIIRISPRSFRYVYASWAIITSHLYGQGKLDMLSGKEDKEGQKGQGDARPMDGAVERVRLRLNFNWSILLRSFKRIG